MEPTLTSHPAVRLGRWLKTKRQAKGIAKYRFAMLIELAASEYTEAEAGVVGWIGEAQAELIAYNLELSEKLVEKFQKMLLVAKDAPALIFAQLFSRQQLEPMRLRAGKRWTPDAATKEIILNAVFSPLPSIA